MTIFPAFSALPPVPLVSQSPVQLALPPVPPVSLVPLVSLVSPVPQSPVRLALLPVSLVSLVPIFPAFSILPAFSVLSEKNSFIASLYFRYRKDTASPKDYRKKSEAQTSNRCLKTRKISYANPIHNLFQIFYYSQLSYSSH